MNRKFAFRARALCSATAIVLCASAAADAPQQFAPGIISAPEQSCVTFAPEGTTAYFVRHVPSRRLMVSHHENGAWTTPQTLPFSGPGSGRMFDGDPAMSPDGLRLFFTSKRTEHDQTQIWRVERHPGGWSTPEPVADGLCGPSVAADGTLYFCARTNDTHGGTDMYRSRLVNGRYAAPENLGDGVNSAANEYDTFIAPDQSYLIFTRVTAPGESAIYITQREGEHWTPPRALSVPSGMNVCPVVTPDGKSFLYTVGPPKDARIYRMDAGLLRANAPQPFAPGPSGRTR